MTNGNDPINCIDPDLPRLCGLTKREYFAAMAMQGMLAHGCNVHEYKDAANYATNAADELINALNKKK